LTFFVEEDCPESHVEVEDGNEGKSINCTHNFLNQR
jgi:hypothetical protein